jgi:hypothetical protein
MVRVLNDGAADESNRQLGSLAYTSGNSIVFANGAYAPHTSDGRSLLAHEIAHVVQGGSLIRTYRPRTKRSFNFGKVNESGLAEDSFDVKTDRETKPWIEEIVVKYTAEIPDVDGTPRWIGVATATYFPSAVALPPLVLSVSGGSRSPEFGLTHAGTFRVTRIEGVGYNSGKFSDPPKRGEREGPLKRYSKDLLGNMNYAVFFYGGEALHEGPLDSSSHGCVHVDWDDPVAMKQVN